MNENMIVIEQLTREFETAWLCDSRPTLQEYLERVAPGLKLQLLKSLLPLEVEHRHRRGEAITADDYHSVLSSYPIELAADIQTILLSVSELSDPVLLDTVEISQDRSTDLTRLHVAQGLAGLNTEFNIPGFRIQSEIAKGGMGKVYAAFDLTLGREVAIKTLLPGADAQRFIGEAQITAKLPHPGIPPIHALGKLPNSTPWLAMKLIRGETLAVLLKKRAQPHESLADYIQVFEQIALAVGFAHSRSIIHRDLKPLNVMVGEFGEVQVMDWGLAKDLRGDETGEISRVAMHNGPDQTAFGTVMGTPGYMSPEQARGEAVDARTDVFALGSILAAILTGQPAFTGTTSREVLQKSASGDTSEVLNRLKKCDVDDELKSIAIRCLEVERERRPENAREIASEVAKYRTGVEQRLRRAETEAAEANVREQEQRKRRRTMQWASGIVAMVLLIGIIGTSLGMKEAFRQAGIANQEFRAKEEALKAETFAKREAEEKRKEAERNLDYARKGNEILGSIFSGLEPKAIAESGRPLQDVLKDNLVTAVKELEAASIGDPLEVAELQTILGASLLGLGESKLASDVFAKAWTERKARLGANHLDSVKSLNNLALSYQAAGEPQKSLELLKEMVGILKVRLAADDPDLLTALSNLALAYQAMGDMQQAIPIIEQVYQITETKNGADDPVTLIRLNNLASVYHASGDIQKALPLHERLVEALKSSSGIEHPNTLIAMNNLAACYRDAGSLEQSLAIFEQVLNLRKSTLGPDHPSTLESMNNLAAIYFSTKKIELAISLLEDTAKLYEIKHGVNHPNTLVIMKNLGNAYLRVGEKEKAVSCLEETLERMRSSLGTEHPDTIRTMSDLATTYTSQGNFEIAVPLLQEALELKKVHLGIDHPSTFITMSNLADGYEESGELELALPIYEELVRLSQNKLGADHPDTLTRLGNLGVAYCKNSQMDRGEETLKKYVDGLRRTSSNNDSEFAGVLMQVAYLLLEGGRFTTAEAMLRDCLTIRQKLEPEEWTTFNTMSTLGGAMLAQQKHSDAESLLVTSYNELERRQSAIPEQVRAERMSQALDRLIQLYTALNQPVEVEKYQKLRAAFSTEVRP